MSSRRANVQWKIPDGTVSYDGASLAVLMDLRDELQRLNRLLHCGNFTAIPHKLERIARNTTKRKRKPK